MCLYVVGFQSSALFFCIDSAATEIYTLSLHDALPISIDAQDAAEDVDEDGLHPRVGGEDPERVLDLLRGGARVKRSEEHTSELQSRLHLVCRLLLEKKN